MSRHKYVMYEETINDLNTFKSSIMKIAILCAIPSIGVLIYFAMLGKIVVTLVWSLTLIFIVVSAILRVKVCNDFIEAIVNNNPNVIDINIVIRAAKLYMK